MSDLKELQPRVVQMRDDRGFTTEPLRVFTLLTEEIGEIAGQLKRTWSENYAEFDKRDLADEISDCIVLLLALAHCFEIDAAQTIEEKFFDRDGRRTWQTAEKGTANKPDAGDA